MTVVPAYSLKNLQSTFPNGSEDVFGGHRVYLVRITDQNRYLWTKKDKVLDLVQTAAMITVVVGLVAGILGTGLFLGSLMGPALMGTGFGAAGLGFGVGICAHPADIVYFRIKEKDDEVKTNITSED